MVDSLDTQVTAALASKASESLTLEYKTSPYEATEGGRKEFAKDLSAFANRNGGLLVIGIREEAGVPVEVVGVPSELVDQAVLWLESVARSNVVPHLTGVRIKPIEHQGRILLVIEVPPGLDAPYEVPAAGARFFVREERSVRAMSREELKFAVRREADLAQRITAFCDECWAGFAGDDRSSTMRLDDAQGGCQLVIFPLFDQSFSFRFDLPAVVKKFPFISAFHQREIGSSRATIAGIDYPQPKQGNGFSGGFVRLYRHGAIQIADGYTMDFRTRDGKELPHPGKLLMDGLLESIKDGIDKSADVTGATSFLIDFRIRTRPGYRVAFYNNAFDSGYGEADRQNLLFDPIVVDLADGWKDRLPGSVATLLHQIWQAFGFNRCEYLNEKNEYIPPK